MRKPARTGLVTLALALSGIAPMRAGASVVYDNGEPGSSGIEVTIRVLAEDVLLAEDATVTGVRFWAVVDRGAFPATIEYLLFESDGNVPAETPFASGMAQNVQAASEGGAERFTFDLEAPAALEAGTVYWLGLHLDDDFQEETSCCVFWSLLPSGESVGSPAASAEFGVLSSWGLTPNHHAFQLLPEPGAAGGSAAALATLAAVARRRASAGGRSRRAAWQSGAGAGLREGEPLAYGGPRCVCFSFPCSSSSFRSSPSFRARPPPPRGRSG